MSVGPGKIRSWTAEGSVPKKKLVVVKKKKPAPGHELGQVPTAPAKVVKATKPASPPQKPARPPSMPVRAAAKPAFDAPKKPSTHESTRIKLKLCLDQKQRTYLEAVFRAPKALASLLRSYPKELRTKADASAFLLSNRKELDGVINPDRRESDVDLLTELLLQWAGNPPESVGIDFDDASLTQENKVYLPLPGLRAVEVFELDALIEERKGRRYVLPFTLFEEAKHFFLALSFEPGEKHVPRSGRHQHLDANGKVKEIKLKPGQPLPYISSPRYLPKEPRQRVLFSRYSGVFRGIKTMNWGDLSGRSVCGGLPSLGKRAR